MLTGVSQAMAMALGRPSAPAQVTRNAGMGWISRVRLAKSPLFVYYSHQPGQSAGIFEVVSLLC